MRISTKVRISALILAATLFTSPLAAAPNRIVSLTPVGTEILFALGQGDRIAAVTEFCDTPEEARLKPQIGGFAAFGLESLLAMETDLVVMQDIHAQFAPQFEQLGIPYVMLRQSTLEEVLASIEELGLVCDASQEASEMMGKLRREISRAAEGTTEGSERTRVLMCVSRELSEPSISAFYAAGRGTFYDELLELAGGVNAVPPGGSPYPMLSPEGLAKVDPDVIIDLVGDRGYYHSMEPVDEDLVFDTERLKRQWVDSADTRAARDGRVHVLEGTVFLRPGPEMWRILRALAEIVHPEREVSR
ncbi:MAG: ABC transporter substrate-binding protein [Synergistaceae bacterium]|nr:helical backbone metal receptor [Synergistota bacterium]NLM72369.1 ABC transporter substrate-binding protein [Synergistaceae bacterium]